MTSRPPSTADEFPLHIPTTPEDVEALRRARPPAPDWDTYLAFLASLPQPSFEALRSRPGPRGEPFRLPGAAGDEG